MKAPFLPLFLGLALLSTSHFYFPSLFLFSLSLLLLLCFLFYFHLRCTYVQRAYCLFLALSFLFFSLISFNDTDAKSPKNFSLEKTSVIAKVVSIPRVSQTEKSKSIFFLSESQKLITFEDGHKKTRALHVPVYVKIFHTDFVPVYGDEVLLYGEISRLSKESSRFTKDYLNRWRKKGVEFTLTGYGRNALEVLKKKNRLMHVAQVFRKKIEGAIDGLWSTPIDRYYLKALLLGQKHWVPRTDREAFSRVGVAHILVVSGLHVTLIAGMVIALLFLIGYSPFYVSLVACIFIFFYAMIAGLAIPIIRASMMSVTMLLSFILRRHVHALNLLFFSASVLLICDSTVLFDVSFQLSFLAVLAIIANQSLSLRFFIDPRFFTFFSFLTLFKKTGLILMITFPVLIRTFNEFSWMGLVSNIFVIPAFSIAIFSALMALLLKDVFFVADFFTHVTSGMIHFVRDVVMELSKLSLSSIHLSTPSLMHITIYYLGLLAFFLSWQDLKKRGSVRFLQFSCCLLFYGAVLFIVKPPTSEVSFYLASTQKSFSCLLNFGKSQKWLLTYDRASSRNSIKKKMESYYRRKGHHPITGFLTSKNIKEESLSDHLFSQKYVLSSHAKFNPKTSKIFKRIKKGDYVMLSEQGIHMRVFGVKNNEAVWSISGPDFSMLFMPFFSEEMLQEIKLKTHRSPDLVVLFLKSRPLETEIQTILEQFPKTKVMIDQLPLNAFERRRIFSNVVYLEGEIEMKISLNKSLFTYHFL